MGFSSDLKGLDLSSIYHGVAEAVNLQHRGVEIGCLG
jgi:hypothetical protein